MCKTLKNVSFLVFSNFLGSFWATEYKYFFHFFEHQKSVLFFLYKGFVCSENEGI